MMSSFEAKVKNKTSDTAKKLGISVKTLYRWERSGKLVPKKTSGGHRYYSDKQIQKIISQRSRGKTKSLSFKPSFSLLAIIAIFLSASVIWDTSKVKEDKPKAVEVASHITHPAVLAASDTAYTFNVKLPSIFSDTVTFESDIEAPNIVYSVNNQVGDVTLALTAGSGVTVDGFTVTNADTGSSQKIFKTIKLGSDTFEAGSNTDTLEFAGSGGTSLSIDTSNKKLTFSSSAPDYTQSGWTDNGTSVVLTTTTDTVTVDTFTAGAITATSLTTGGLSLSGDLVVASGYSVLPDTDLGSDLGSASQRFNNLYVANINSNSSQSFAGQTTFSYEPQDTTLTEASVIINPTSPVANGQLLAFGVGGYQKALVDEDGDMVLGYYNSGTAAPAFSNDYPLAIYDHATTEVAYIDTSGNLYMGTGLSSSGALTVTPAAGSNFNVSLSTTGDFAVNTDDLYVDTSTGRVGIGTTSPGTALAVSGSITLLTSSTDKLLLTGAGGVTGQIYQDSTTTTFYTNNSGTNGFLFSKQITSAASGTTNLINISSTFSGTGTAAYTALNLPPVLNYTSSGISRGIFIDPTITSAADWRSLEISNNSHYAIYQSGASATNYLAGKVGIGVTAPTSLLHVTGAVTGKALAIFDETGDQDLLTASASGVTKFTIDHSGNVHIYGNLTCDGNCSDIKLDTYTSDGTYTKPGDATLIVVDAIGAGGGGGGGSTGTTAARRTGGGGGGGGGYITKSFSSSLISSSVSVTVPSGGAGAAAAADGTGGSSSDFGSYISAYGGGGGGNSASSGGGGGGGGGSLSTGGSSTDQTGGNGGEPGGGAEGSPPTDVLGYGGGGGATSTAGGAATLLGASAEFGGAGGAGSSLGGSASGDGGSSVYGGAGGGGGGSNNVTICTAQDGGAGGSNQSYTAGGGGTLGSSGGSAGGNGSDSTLGLGGDGGGGGGNNCSGTGGAGGTGGIPGGGGGGGGGGSSSGGAGGTGGRGEVRVWTISSNAADLAEIYTSNDNSLEAGDVVAVDSSLRAGVKKTTSAYETGTLGIISTRPNTVIGDAIKEGTNVVPVALAGRVPVKVNLENGPIESGDYLTSSSTPGVAMKATKAGITIGTAIGSYHGDEGENDKITAFVNTSYTQGMLIHEVLSKNGYEIPEEVWKSDNIDYSWVVLTTLVSEGKTMSKDQVAEIYGDRVAANLEIIAPRIVTDTIYTDNIKTNNNSNLIIGLGSDTDASPSAKLVIQGLGGNGVASIDAFGNLTANGLEISKEATISGLLNASQGGVATYTKEGTIDDTDFTTTPVDGFLGIDSTDGRLYVRNNNGNWNYIAFTDGFQIPSIEATGLEVGDLLLPYVENKMTDGALHGLYKKFDIGDFLTANQLSILNDQITFNDEITNKVLGLETTTNNFQVIIANIQKALSDFADRFKTKELCLEENGNETCVTKSQLDEVLKIVPSPTPTVVPVQTPTIVDSPVPTASPTETPIPTETILPTESPVASPSATPTT